MRPQSTGFWRNGPLGVLRARLQTLSKAGISSLPPSPRGLPGADKCVSATSGLAQLRATNWEDALRGDFAEEVVKSATGVISIDRADTDEGRRADPRCFLQAIRIKGGLGGAGEGIRSQSQLPAQRSSRGRTGLAGHMIAPALLENTGTNRFANPQLQFTS